MTSEKDPLISERSGRVREVGNHAIWSLSSCKPDNISLVCMPFGKGLFHPSPFFPVSRQSGPMSPCEFDNFIYRNYRGLNCQLNEDHLPPIESEISRAIQSQKNDKAPGEDQISNEILKGFGIDQLRDDCMDTYWQSDGQLPHLVNIQFQRKTMVSHIYIYTDYKLDESYTPSRISIRAGTHFNDLQEIEVIELIEPSGWEMIPIKDMHDRPIRTFMIQIAVLSNHQNGRDTHMRQIKVHSPCEPTSFDINKFRNFSTVQFQQYTTIR